MAKTTKRTVIPWERKIDRKIAERVLSVVKKGLSEGLEDEMIYDDAGKQVVKPGHVCVEAAICYAYGQPHSDSPGCVLNMIRGDKITLNDEGGWADNKERARGMVRLAIAQLGSKGVVTPAAWKKAKEAAVEDLVNRINTHRLGRVKGLKEVLAASAWCPDSQSLSTLYNLLGEALFSSHELVSCYDINGEPEWRFHLAEAWVQALIAVGSPGAKYVDLAPIPKECRRLEPVEDDRQCDSPPC